MVFDTEFLSNDEQMKLNIAHSVYPSINEATVSKICLKAGISRQTFYKHFTSKYDISNWYKCFISQFYLFKIGKDYSWEEGMERHFSLCYKEFEYIRRNLLSHYQGNAADVDSIINSISWKKLRLHHLVENIADFGTEEIDERLNYCIEMFVEIEAIAFRKWLITEPTMPPEELARCLVACIPGPLYDVFAVSKTV